MTRARVLRGCGHAEFIDLYGNQRAQREELARLKKEEPCPECGYVGTEPPQPEITEEEIQNPAPRNWATTADQAMEPEIKTNRYAGRCERCGRMVPPGHGHLYYGGDEYESHTPGWRVRCIDSDACDDYLSNPARLYR